MILGSLGAVLCLAGAQLAPTVHYANATHEVCDEHGHLVHAEGEVEAPTPADEHEHEHEHCAPQVFALEATEGAALAPPLRAPDAVDALPVRPSTVLPVRSTRVYRLAPKTSPPA